MSVRCMPPRWTGKVEPVYTVKEVAGVLRCCEATVKTMCANKQIKASKTGARWKITESELIRFLSEGQNYKAYPDDTD